MAKVTQRRRIESIFGGPRISCFLAFSRSGRRLTVAELALPSNGTGSGRSSANDDAYLILTNVGEPYRLSIDRADRPSFDDIVPSGRTVIVDLSAAFDVSWSGAVNAVAAYLPRSAIFEGRDGMEGHVVADGAVLDDDMLGAIMACLRHAAGPSNPHESEVFARQLLAAACDRLARIHAVPTSNSRVRNGALSEAQLEAAFNCILDHLDSPISMHKVAAACGLSYGAFCRSFHRAVGASPHDWAMATRVERAKELMLDASLRLCDIALAVGFCDQSHFNRVFTRFSSCTPGAWRRYQDEERASRHPEMA